MSRFEPGWMPTRSATLEGEWGEIANGPPVSWWLVIEPHEISLDFAAGLKRITEERDERLANIEEFFRVPKSLMATWPDGTVCRVEVGQPLTFKGHGIVNLRDIV